VRRFARIAAGAVAAGAVAVGLATTATLPGITLTRAVTRKVQPAAVQLGPMYQVKDPTTGRTTVRAFGWGSGTILDRSGNILTNQHVTDTTDIADDLAKDGASIIDGKLVVFMTRRTDEPAIPVFVATVVTADPDLDIAIVRITEDLDGGPVDLSTVNLPSVPLGDSDAVELGDTLNIFGYPGIGGTTITFTTGPVSGFATDAAIPGTAWIKTSASISGGNSGGTGVDDDGALVGVPTRTGVEGAGGFVDCRRLADTNADGTIDESDTCVPTGGFINSLRAVNVAKTLIGEAVQADRPTPEPTPAPAPAGTSPGAPTTTIPSRGPTTTRPTARTTTTAAAGDEPDDGSEGPAEPRGSVTVNGTITDAATGKPLPGVRVTVLRPGVSWADDPRAGDVLTTAVSDSRGWFELGEPLARSGRYAMAAGALTTHRSVATDDVLVPADAMDPSTMNLRLERR
jgi:S1-C subfamily serine protease